MTQASFTPLTPFQGLTFGILRNVFTSEGQRKVADWIIMAGGRATSVRIDAYNTGNGSYPCIDYLVVPSLEMLDLAKVRTRSHGTKGSGSDYTDDWTQQAATHSVPIVDDKWVRIQATTPTGACFSLDRYGANYDMSGKGRKRSQHLSIQRESAGRKGAGPPQIDIASAIFVHHDSLPPPNMPALWYREMLAHHLIKFINIYDGTAPGASMKDCLKSFMALDWAAIFKDYGAIFKSLARRRSVVYVHADDDDKWPTPPSSPTLASLQPSLEVLRPLSQKTGTTYNCHGPVDAQYDFQNLSSINSSKHSHGLGGGVSAWQPSLPTETCFKRGNEDNHDSLQPPRKRPAYGPNPYKGGYAAYRANLGADEKSSTSTTAAVGRPMLR